MVTVAPRLVGILGLLAVAWTLPAQAAWELDPDASQVDATVIEITPDGPVPHQHRMRKFEGSIDSEGNLSIPLRLSQLDAIESIGPLPSWFTRIADKPAATVTAQIPPQQLDSLAVGESLTETLQFSVESQNEKREAPVELRFTRETQDRISVTNAQRIALDGQQVMANQNAQTILQLLGYEQIGDEIPITLEAVLQNNN